MSRRSVIFLSLASSVITTHVLFAIALMVVVHLGFVPIAYVPNQLILLTFMSLVAAVGILIYELRKSRINS